MSSTEPSVSPTRKPFTSLRKGLQSVGDNASSNSLLTTTSAGDDDKSGLRSSIDGAIGKLKQRRRKSVDERRNSGDSTTANRLSKLVPGKKKRKKNSTAVDDPSSLSYLDDDRRPSTNPSESSLGLEGSGRSSLLTDDSDIETKPTRPTLSPHQSHAGYLTLSSPLIKAQSTDSAPGIEEGPEVTVEAGNTGPTIISPSSAPIERRLSLVERLKGASNPSTRKQVGEAGPVKGDNNTVGEGGTGSRRNSTSLRADEEQPFQDGQAAAQTPTRGRLSGLSALERPQRIDTTLPATPPNAAHSSVVTPSTLVTPPTPVIASPPSPTEDSTPTKSSLSPLTKTSSTPKTPTSGVRLRNRNKLGSLPGSKLSNAVNASPLTPTIEEAKTPGGSLTSPGGPSGFFSGFFNAAQNAANQLSNSINTSIAANQKGKSPLAERVGESSGEEVIPGLVDQSLVDTPAEKRRELAVETLGSGDLSLSHLGISESSDPSPMTSAADMPEIAGQDLSTESSQKTEETAAARAVSMAYEKPVASLVSQAHGARPLSVASADAVSGEQTPSPPIAGDGGSIGRSGSVRSRISNRTRRHRGSSATTGATLAAAISASTSTLAHPGSAAAGAGHRLTGFAVASGKRNKDFHQLFRSVPEDDYLIEDYSAALQRDILLHGRLYVSEGHICFSSNILGWVTNLVIGFDEIVSMEKKNTAVIFPNAIVIQTLHARNIFASLVARDSTYELLIGIWKISHPNLKSSLNGVSIDDSNLGDKTEKADSTGSDDGSEEGSDDVYDEDDEENADVGSFTEAGGNGSIAGSDVGDVGRTVSRKTSTVPVSTGGQTNGATPSALQTTDAAVTGAAVGLDYPGQPTHAATECGDVESHYDKPLTDTTIPAPLGKVYSLMWGPASGAFMRKWMVEDQKSKELAYEDDKTGLDETHRTFGYSYIKPLNAPVGPKQTKCITTCTLELYDLDKAVIVSCSTQTPDVPSGSIFTTKTRYCLMWGPDNSTRFIANCTIEWTGKSWLKGPIEKGANDGQIQYVKDIVAAIKAAVVTRPPVRGPTNSRTKGKTRRRRGETLDTAASDAAREKQEAAAKADEASWGLLEPVRGVLEPVGMILKPLFSAQVVIAVLVLLQAWTWFFGARGAGGGGRVGGRGLSPRKDSARFAAYEEVWRREESELWDWLEDRVGVAQGLLQQPRNGASDGEGRQKLLRTNAMGRKLEGEGMNERMVEDAISVTEERLMSLKEAVRKQKRTP